VLNWRKEPASGTVDGVNQTFSTSVPYASGTLRAFLNGLLLSSGVSELGGADFELDFAPEPADQVAVFFQVNV
jgi:hypothetical protein